MSFLHPFTVSISRTAYSSTSTDGLTQSETVIVASTSASIQLKRDKGFSAPTAFPAPTNTSASMPAWLIYIPLTTAINALGMAGIKDGDLITDLADGRQFKADACEYTPIEWQIACTPYKPTA